MPENKLGCNIPCAGTLEDEKFLAFSYVVSTGLLGIIVHRFGQTTTNISKSLS
jgi:hypothetical protein